MSEIPISDSLVTEDPGVEEAFTMILCRSRVICLMIELPRRGPESAELIKLFNSVWTSLKVETKDSILAFVADVSRLTVTVAAPLVAAAIDSVVPGMMSSMVLLALVY